MQGGIKGLRCIVLNMNVHCEKVSHWRGQVKGLQLRRERLAVLGFKSGDECIKNKRVARLLQRPIEKGIHVASIGRGRRAGRKVRRIIEYITTKE